MIKGILIIKYENDTPEDDTQKVKSVRTSSGKKISNGNNIKWNLVSAFVPTKEDQPSGEIIYDMLTRFKGSPQLSFLNYRVEQNKYYISPINNHESKFRYFSIFILDVDESLEIVRVYGKEFAESCMESVKSASKLKGVLEKSHRKRNKILDKLVKADVLQTDVGSKANKMIDAGNFAEAQDFIKLVKNIPEKMVNGYLKGIVHFHSKEYKRAEREFHDCINYARKLNEKDLEIYLGLKIGTTQQIPSYEKELRVLYKNFIKTLSKRTQFLPYYELEEKLQRTLDLLDHLERDTQIEQITELEEIVNQSFKYAQKLRMLDIQAKKLIQDLKNY